MEEFAQLVPYVNWNSVVVPVKFEPWNQDAATIISLPSPDWFTSSPQNLVEAYLQAAQTDDTIIYVRHAGGEPAIQNALDSLNQLFACEPCQVVETFAEYISQSRNYLDGPRNKRQELVSPSTLSRYRQVCSEAEARDHVIHLETITLAKEQEAPIAIAVGQMLISGRELWKSCKKRLLDSFSSYSRNWSTPGSPTFASGVVASSY